MWHSCFKKKVKHVGLFHTTKNITHWIILKFKEYSDQDFLNIDNRICSWLNEESCYHAQASCEAKEQSTFGYTFDVYAKKACKF